MLSNDQTKKLNKNCTQNSGLGYVAEDMLKFHHNFDFNNYEQGQNGKLKKYSLTVWSNTVSALTTHS